MKHFGNLLTVFFMLFFSNSFAQTRLEQAEKAFENKDYFEALQLFEKALAKEKIEAPGEVYFRMGECHRYGNDFAKAMEHYVLSEKAGYDAPQLKFQMGGTLIKLGKYQEAKKRLNEFLELMPNDPDGLRLLENCEFALRYEEEPSIFTVINETTLNSEFSDYGAVYFKDRIIFSSSRIEAGVSVYSFDGQGFSNLYESMYQPKDKNWKRASKISELSSNYNDGAIAYCAQIKTAFFTQCNVTKGKPAVCNIMESRYDEATNKWSAPKIVNIEGVSADVAHPAISSDGNTLIFASRREGGLGGSDLWMSKRQSAKWSAPENLGNTINTSQDELFPVFFKDSVLYFSSEGHTIIGGLDLFFSVWKNETWSLPVNMKKPFNSAADDFYLVFHENEEEGFFTSNRTGGKGSDDIYRFFLSPITLTVKGKVLDDADKKPLKDAKLMLTTGEGKKDSLLTNSKGEYQFKLDRNLKYKINVSLAGFFGDSKTLSTVGEKFSKEFSKEKGLDYDFILKKIPKEEITIPDIYYDYNQYTLREESKESLDKLVKLLEDTPEALIQINAHTDERGEQKYNMTLSENRAKSVVEYLIENGIDKNRLTSKGFGFSMPVVKNAKTEEQHQLNRRTTFKVMN